MTLREAIEFFFLRDSKKCIHFAYKNLWHIPQFFTNFAGKSSHQKTQKDK